MAPYIGRRYDGTVSTAGSAYILLARQAQRAVIELVLAVSQCKLYFYV